MFFKGQNEGYGQTLYLKVYKSRYYTYRLHLVFKNNL